MSDLFETIPESARRNPGAIRATSLAAFQEIRGELSEKRRKVYDALVAYGPMAAFEVEERLHARGLWRRFSELERAGLIERTTVRVNPKTDRHCDVWRIVPDDRIESARNDQEAVRTFLKKMHGVARSLDHLLTIKYPMVIERKTKRLGGHCTDPTVQEVIDLCRFVSRRTR